MQARMKNPAALLLSPSRGFQPIVDISDELAERELFGDMVSDRKNKTEAGTKVHRT
jgi:hypothetical protein